MANHKRLSLLLCVSLTLVVALSMPIREAPRVKGNNCQGTPNLYDFWTEDPQLVTEIKNAKLYYTGGPQLEPQIRVVHLYGTDYEMGFAHGQILKDEVNFIYNNMYNYLYQEIDQYLHLLPPAMRHVIEVDGVDAALELTYNLTKPHIPPHFIQEVQGLADGANMTFDYVIRLLLFPELIQASCSMMGAYGKSIASTDGTLIQLRALDWDTDTPMQNYPAVIVYHPTDGSHTFAILSWSGFIGALTGMSSSEVAICEKVWDGYTGRQNRAGIPFHFLLRDILQFDSEIDDALSRIASVDRTCAIFIGVGDSSPDFKAVAYSFEEVKIINDHNMANHTTITDVVYIDKHVQPSSDPCLPSLIEEFYGSIDANITIRHLAAEFQTGDMHVAVFDFANHLMYVSNASPYVNNSAIPAYNRPFTMLNMTTLFSEPAPSVDASISTQTTISVQAND